MVAAGTMAIDPARRTLKTATERAVKDVDAARSEGAGLVAATGGEQGFKDTNYIFLSFVTRYLPAGIVGLVIAVILAATMSSSSGEINSLATVIGRRHLQAPFPQGRVRPSLSERLARGDCLLGCYAVAFAGFGKNLGSLIEAVNIVGSLFYGSLLGVFVLAFFFKRVTGTGRVSAAC